MFDSQSDTLATITNSSRFHTDLNDLNVFISNLFEGGTHHTCITKLVQQNDTCTGKTNYEACDKGHTCTDKTNYEACDKGQTFRYQSV
mgnify:FL=1